MMVAVAGYQHDGNDDDDGDGIGSVSRRMATLGVTGCSIAACPALDVGVGDGSDGGDSGDSSDGRQRRSVQR